MKRAAKTRKNNNSISAKEAADILGISTATIRNWARLGKLKTVSERPLQFSEKEISAMLKKLDNNALLRSRRNKTRSTENFIPKNYISSSSPNLGIIKDLLDELTGVNISASAIISYYAKDLLAKGGIPSKIAGRLLEPLNALENISENIPDKSNIATLSDMVSRFPLKFIPGEDTLGMLYLSVRNLQDKKSTGSYYTPYFVADRLISDVLTIGNEKLPQRTFERSVCDPACGTGNFLLRLPENIPLEQVHGFDIDPVALQIARINLALKHSVTTDTGLNILSSNLKVRDFLSCDSSKKASSVKFDIIIGNPPWGFIFKKDEISRLRHFFSSYRSGKMPESFALFVERAILCLKDKGVLSFLLPQTILSADTHRGIRRYILDNAFVTSLSYLGEVFHKVQCPSIILTLQKEKADTISVSFLMKQKELLLNERSFKRFDYPVSAGSFHILADTEEQAILDRIASTPHFTLKDQAEFALGIVTGSNSTMLKSIGRGAPGSSSGNMISAPLEPILKGKEIEKFHTLPAGSFTRFTPEKFQQCAPERVYRADKKLFYRFIADEPVVALDTGRTLSLNSANILIPDVPGYSAEYIMAVLNSKVLSFYYRKTFKNLKVLRSYLEQLPIAKCAEDDKVRIEKLVLELTKLYASDSADRSAIASIRRELDEYIADIYGLKDEIDSISL